MKKIVFLLTLMLFLCSCGAVGHDGGVTLEIPKDFAEALTYKGSLPTLRFVYDGVVNTSKNKNTSFYYFGSNDYYKFSEAYATHLSQYGTNTIIKSTYQQTLDHDTAKFGKENLPLDNLDSSFEYMMVAWTSTGERYSYHYRKFVSDGKTYYAYPYSSPISISMEIPLMVIPGGKKHQIVLLNLPYDTIYQVNINLKLSTLQTDEEYLDEKFTKFSYPDYLSGLTTVEKKVKILEWYQNHSENYQLTSYGCTFNYCGNTFSCELFETYFQIKYLS